MSSTNKTSLGLNMWEGSDKPVRQDFVNDNVIINEKITKLNSDLQNQITTTYSNLALKANASDLDTKAGIYGITSRSSSALNFTFVTTRGQAFFMVLISAKVVLISVDTSIITSTISTTGVYSNQLIAGGPTLNSVSAIKLSTNNYRIKLDFGNSVAFAGSITTLSDVSNLIILD